MKDIRGYLKKKEDSSEDDTASEKDAPDSKMMMAKEALAGDPKALIMLIQACMAAGSSESE